ncbi:hypothetical protein [Longispora fulva]|uniref:Uncharacterized protein n=1 Tax=Longispora fulva TaxID=619741 RepID=A0A8J7KNP7_9ACTN|nr:hypothetical protein [Longispora fulva]MBG6140481.1 hypothetical protein [Longispora fulva]
MTIVDVRGMFGRAARAAASIGLDTTGWYLEGGSQVQGVAWRMHTHGSATPVALENARIGSTAREAYAALHMLALAWEAAGTVQAERAPERVLIAA